MKNLSTISSTTAVLAAMAFGAGLFLAGCGTPCDQGSCSDAPGASSCCPASDDDHGHQHEAAGSHGGKLIELGEGQYLAELVIHKDTHKVAVYLLDAEAKKPAAGDRIPIVMQIFEDGKFVDYTLEAIPADAKDAGVSQFATVNEKLSDAVLGSDQLRGRLKVSIQGKPLVGIFECHAHGQSDLHNDDGDHDHGADKHEHAHGDTDHAK